MGQQGKLRVGILVATSMVWLAAVGVGLAMLWGYENTSGVAGAPPSEWPTNSSIVPVSGRPTLVMIAHPHCPCTRASIGELALLMARCQGHVSAYVLFFRPSAFEERWEKTDLFESAAGIPGVTVLSDEDGVEATRFNAETSGATMLYDPDGHLLFSGGITASRGHSGDNEGRSAIVEMVSGERPTRTGTPVYGCSLVGNDKLCLQGDGLCKQ